MICLFGFGLRGSQKKNRETKSGVKFAAFKRFSGPREMLGKTYYFSRRLYQGFNRPRKFYEGHRRMPFS